MCLEEKKNIGQYIGILNLQINKICKIPYLVGFNIFCKVLNHLVSVVSAWCSSKLTLYGQDTLTLHMFTTMTFQHSLNPLP